MFAVGSWRVNGCSRAAGYEQINHIGSALFGLTRCFLITKHETLHRLAANMG